MSFVVSFEAVKEKLLLFMIRLMLWNKKKTKNTVLLIVNLRFLFQLKLFLKEV